MYEYYLTALITFLVIWFLLFSRYVMTKKIDGENLKQIYKEDIQTGDIIILDFQSIQSLFIASLFRNNYMHPSIALWQDGELFMVELMGYSDKKGLLKIPFEEWKRRNRHGIAKLCKLEIEENDKERRELIAKKIEQYYQKYKPLLSTPRGFSWNWRRFWFQVSKQNYLLDELNCSEVLVMILIKCGILSRQHALHDFTPERLSRINSIQFSRPFMYKEKFISYL